MSEATPMPSEPPTPSAEQLAEWQALAERIRQGDRTQVVAWEEAAAGTEATYQVLVARRVHQQLRQAPPRLAGSAVSFGAAGGLLTYWVLQAARIVVLLDLTWSE